MVYLAIQTFALLAATAVAFFALGYGYHRKFSRARLEVSDQPPADPPPHHEHQQEEDPQHNAFVRALRDQLLSKERELAVALERAGSVATVHPPPESQVELDRLRAGMENLKGFNRDLEARNRELAERSLFLERELEEMRQQDFRETPAEMPAPPPPPSAPEVSLEDFRVLTAELSLKSAQTEEMRLETERLADVVRQARQEAEEARAQLEAHQHQGEAREGVWREQEEEWESLLAEREAMRSIRHSLESALAISQSEVLSLREELENRPEVRVEVPAPAPAPVVLATVPDVEVQGDLENAARAIWEDEETSLETVLEDGSEVLEKLDGLSRQNEQMQAEFREKILGLEATIAHLRSDNEMALATVIELTQRPESTPSEMDWAPAPVMPDTERDALVEALWREEKDSANQLRLALEEKERALRDLEAKVRSLSAKANPDLMGPDDLELIKGIGPYIRNVLDRDFGIRTFEQLAHLSPSQAEAISQRLFFKDKIQREDWRGQARTLHFKKYQQAA
ncbi:hypothetical protein K2X33_05480 [bacterium]|nr:hypothetical protein [bacterium]